MKTYKFKAEIKKHPKVNAAFIEFPYSVEEEFGTKGQVKVRVEFDGYEYRGSLAKMRHHCHCVSIIQEIRKAINKEPGDIIQVVLKKDESPRIVEVPEDLAALLNNDLAAKLKNLDVFIVSRKKKNGFYDFPNNFIEKEFGVPATTGNWTTVTKKVTIREVTALR